MKKIFIYTLFFLSGCKIYNQSPVENKLHKENYIEITGFHEIDSINFNTKEKGLVSFFVWEPWITKGELPRYVITDYNGFWYKLKPGIEDGKYSFYDKNNDSLIFTGISVDGKQTGIQRYWYDADSENKHKIFFECEYKDGKKNGFAKYHLYDKTGVKRAFISEYINDSLSKVHLTNNPIMRDTFNVWYENDSILYEVNPKYSPDNKELKNGVNDGFYVVFYDKELKKDTALTAIVKNGEMNYLVKFWDRNGKVIKVVEYLNGQSFGYYLDYLFLKDESYSLLNIYLHKGGMEYLSSIW